MSLLSPPPPQEAVQIPARPSENSIRVKGLEQMKWDDESYVHRLSQSARTLFRDLCEDSHGGSSVPLHLLRPPPDVFFGDWLAANGLHFCDVFHNQFFFGFLARCHSDTPTLQAANQSLMSPPAVLVVLSVLFLPWSHQPVRSDSSGVQSSELPADDGKHAVSTCLFV